MDEYWGLSLDDLIERVWEIKSDAKGGHYIAFAGDIVTARQKLIDAFIALIDQHMYRATAYGSPWQEGERSE